MAQGEARNLFQGGYMQDKHLICCAFFLSLSLIFFFILGGIPTGSQGLLLALYSGEILVDVWKSICGSRT